MARCRRRDVTYSTIMVHLDGGRSNGAVLDTAAAVATRHGATVIGIAACQPVHLGAPSGYLDGEFAVVERDIVTDELARLDTEFHQHAGLHSLTLEWRSLPIYVNVAHAVAEQARSADLVITGVGPATSHVSTHADTGELILNAGRPVLVVPERRATADFATVMVAWRNTRECRRAVSDALPMLHHATRVILVESSEDAAVASDNLDDVAAWLTRHGIDTDRITSRASGSAAESLASIADEQGADLIVAGAYGHSRIREWAFGGVTRDLLLQDRRCTLLAH